MKKYLFISLSFLIIASCGSTSGNRVLLAESELSVDSKIIEGVTTQSEIKAMFGSPFETTFTDGGMEIWKYRFDNLDADAVNYIPIVNMFTQSYSGDRKELVILFNDNGTVKRSSMAESDVTTKAGLFN
ncbi:hypothetical protein OAQ94_05305 [Gammaproteobacteria bacterium]|jgi:hypothetical protein|nr:hypothetical protein [Gammaproteobacteria bacterium]MDC0919337.1 hypothetical protein [Gammaproteobacteria bacterium]MDC1042594.1 hypothetical protein [Gammaproteobacteria bacterium]